MTRLTIILFLLTLVFTDSLFSQETEDTALNREVFLKEINGVKTLTIIETIHGIKSETVYKGSDADEKLAELRGDKENQEEIIEKEVLIENVNGTKKVTVTTITEERIVQEIFTGVAADRVLRELDEEEKKGVIIKKRISREDSLQQKPQTK